MRDAELNELIFNVLISRMRRKGHLGTLFKGLNLSMDEEEKQNDNYQLIKKLIKSVKQIFQHEQTLINIQINNESATNDSSKNRSIIVVGDIHGNIDDLIKIFQKFGYPPYENRAYLFLGDYVDRGSNSLEVIILLFALKVKFPDHIFLIRGNHESKFVSSQYGFKDECITYFDHSIYKQFCHAFSYIPIAATINQSIFCVHGGISPFVQDIEQIKQIQKPIRDVRTTKIVSELLWSDPSSSPTPFSFRPSNRGIGYIYSESDINNFLNKNNLDLIIRAHKFCQKGYSWCGDKCLTVFSSSDYCGDENSAAVVVIEKFKKIEDNCFYNIPSFKFNTNWKLFGDLSVELIRFSTGPFDIPTKMRILIPEWIFINQSPLIPIQNSSTFWEQDDFLKVDNFGKLLDVQEQNNNTQKNQDAIYQFTLHFNE